MCKHYGPAMGHGPDRRPAKGQRSRLDLTKWGSGRSEHPPRSGRKLPQPASCLAESGSPPCGEEPLAPPPGPPEPSPCSASMEPQTSPIRAGPGSSAAQIAAAMSFCSVSGNLPETPSFHVENRWSGLSPAIPQPSRFTKFVDAPPSCFFVLEHLRSSCTAKQHARPR